MTIRDEAVEAAAKAYYQGPNWDDLADWYKQQNLDYARAALEAAAPFIRAEALNDAADDFEGGIGVAEFDELSRHDGGHWVHIEEAWEHQGPYMDWLRARAAEMRQG